MIDQTKNRFSNEHIMNIMIYEIKLNMELYPYFNMLYHEAFDYLFNKFPNDNDIFLIPYIECLYLNNGEQRIVMLSYEETLKTLCNNLGEKQFLELSKKLVGQIKSDTVNSCYLKLLDFYSEVEGMIHFIKKGYKIFLIAHSLKSKTPDFVAINRNEEILVECKFKHQSNPFKSYIDRYSRYIQLFHASNGITLISGATIGFYNDNNFPRSITQNQIDQMKNFYNNIISKRLHRSEITLPYIISINNKKIDAKCVIYYNKNGKLPLAIISTDNQNKYIKQTIDDFEKTNLKLIINKGQEQAYEYIQSNYANYNVKPKVFIFIIAQLDSHLSYVWEDNILKHSEFSHYSNVIIMNGSSIA